MLRSDLLATWPEYARRTAWADRLADAIIEFAPRDVGIDPYVFSGVGDVESLLGTSRLLDEPGPGGRGDRGRRTLGGKYKPSDGGRPGVVDAAGDGLFDPAGPAGPGGWGHGVFQIDASTPGSAQRVFVESGAWKVYPFGADFAAGLLRTSARYFHGLVGDVDLYLRAVIASYNAGEANVHRAMTAGASPDSITHGGDYGAEVLARAYRMRIRSVGKEP
jgi:hypothetical protein